MGTYVFCFFYVLPGKRYTWQLTYIYLNTDVILCYMPSAVYMFFVVSLELCTTLSPVKHMPNCIVIVCVTWLDIYCKWRVSRVTSLHDFVTWLCHVWYPELDSTCDTWFWVFHHRIPICNNSFCNIVIWHLISWHCHQKWHDMTPHHMILSPFQETWSSCSPLTLLWYLSANSCHENDSHILWIGTFQIHIHNFHPIISRQRQTHETSTYIYDVIPIFWTACVNNDLRHICCTNLKHFLLLKKSFRNILDPNCTVLGN